MATGLVDFGEEFFQRRSTDDLSNITTWTIGIYNDTTDSITDSDDIAAITSEPGNTNYSRQDVSASNITFSQVSGDVEWSAPDVTFDLTDNSSSNDFTHWFLVIDYQSNVVGSDGSPTTHLIITGALSDTYTGSSTGNLQVSDVSGSLN